MTRSLRARRARTLAGALLLFLSTTCVLKRDRASAGGGTASAAGNDGNVDTSAGDASTVTDGALPEEPMDAGIGDASTTDHDVLTSDASGSDTIDAGPCEAEILAFAPAADPVGGSCPATRCDVGDSGVVMSYCMDVRDDAGTVGWGGCDLGTSGEILAFDSDEPLGDQGILEVRACTIGQPASGALNLWYGEYPARRWLSLFSNGMWANGQPVVADECVTLQFRPSEASYAIGLEGDTSVYPPAGCPLANLCGTGGPACLPEGGLMPSLALTGEWAQAPTQGVVRLESVRHYTAGCLCRSDESCAPGKTCVALHNAGTCADPAAPGVCTECVGAGASCQVLAGGRSCDASFVCVGGLLVCPCAP